MQKKIVLLTGATGFIGNQLLKKLLAKGFKIKALTNSYKIAERRLSHPNVYWFDFDFSLYRVSIS